jgi:hypothetical protein
MRDPSKPAIKTTQRLTMACVLLILTIGIVAFGTKTNQIVGAVIMLAGAAGFASLAWRTKRQ